MPALLGPVVLSPARKEKMTRKKAVTEAPTLIAGSEY